MSTSIKIIIFFIVVFSVSGISLADTLAAASCSSTAVTTAISASSNGDTVTVPAGSCSWSGGIDINKAIKLIGNGIGSTNIANPSVQISAANVSLSGFSFTGGVFNISGSNFRIHHNVFTVTADFLNVVGSYGLIDNNTINSSGQVELIHVYGPDNSWSIADSYGTANAVYVEDNTFISTTDPGPNQAVHCNYNGRFVVRYNTIQNMKVDVHGLWSNGDPAHYGDWTHPTIHSCRHYEIYGNHFRANPNNGSVNFGRSMEIRGGTGFIFNNEFTGNSMGSSEGYPKVMYEEYCAEANTGNCPAVVINQIGSYLTPSGYPAHEQLGRGLNQLLQPLYMWDYKVNGTEQTPVPSPGWPSSGAIAQYGSSFTTEDIVKRNRDYYVNGVTFNGTTGIGIGTLASRPATCTPNVGYWATDQGSWNTIGANGIFYKCTSTNTWTLYYTPYTYPHQLTLIYPAISPVSNFR